MQMTKCQVSADYRTPPNSKKVRKPELTFADAQIIRSNLPTTPLPFPPPQQPARHPDARNAPSIQFEHDQAASRSWVASRTLPRRDLQNCAEDHASGHVAGRLLSSPRKNGAPPMI
jgi:hypothetical protein